MAKQLASLQPLLHGPLHLCWIPESTPLVESVFFLLNSFFHFQNEQFMAQSMDLEPMTTRPVACLRWNQRLALALSIEEQCG